jgi:hypothetical protein
MIASEFHDDFERRISQNLENVTYSGKNMVAKCPYCGKEKKFYYSSKGIKSNSGMFNCFSCKASGNGYELLQKLGDNQSLDHHEPRIPLKSFIPIEITLGDSKPKLFIDYGDWEYRFPILNQSGEELYVKLLKHSKAKKNNKGKFEKTIGFIHKAEDGIYYWGMGGRRSIFYGINKIKQNSEIVFIVEGEKKRDRLEKCLNEYYRGNEFSIISPITGSSQELDDETLTALKFANPKKIVLIPDLDSDLTKGFKFVKDNNSILLLKGFNSFIYNLRENIADENPFDGYDIYDALYEHEEVTVKDLINVCSSYEYLIQYQQRYLWDNRNGSEIAFNSPFINQSFSFEFIYEELKQYTSPCLLIRSIQGTGKTTFLMDIIKGNFKILYISSRAALCIEVAKLLGIKDYQSVLKSNHFVDRLCESYSDSLAVCIDSIHNFDYIRDHFNEYIVIFDEVDSILNTIFIAKHILKPKYKNYIRQVYFRTLIEIITNAKMSICMSSDIPTSNKNLIKNIKWIQHAESDSIPMFQLSNYYQDKKLYFGYHSKIVYLNKIIELLSSGEKVTISVNSKEEIVKLEYLILNGVKDRKLKILKITSVKTKESSKAIKSKDFSEFDCVIYSPTIFTGNDFNVEFSDYHFVFSANNRTTDHYELLQSCFRFRRSKEVHFYFKTNKKKGISDSETIKKRITVNTIQTKKYFTPIISSKENRLFVETYSELKAEKDNSLNDLEFNFVSLIDSRGAKVVYIQDKNETSHDFKTMAQNFRVHYRERISNLPIIGDKKRLKAISNGMPALDEDEKDAVDKSEIYHLLEIPRDTSSYFVERLVTKSSPRKVFEQLHNNIVLISEFNEVIKMDEINQDSLLTGELTKINLNKVFQKCFNVLFNLSPEELNPDKLRSIISEVEIDPPKLAELTLLIKNDPDLLRFWKGKKGNISYFIRTLFNDTLGWGLIGRQESDKNRTRSYRINREGFNLFMNAASNKKGFLN